MGGVLSFFRNSDVIREEQDVAGRLGVAISSGATHKQIFAILGMEWEGGEDNTLPNNKTPLHHASQNGNVEVIKVLVELGVNVNEVDLDWCTALHYAAANSKLDAIKTLVELGAITDACTGDGWTPLHVASIKRNVEVIKVLVELGAITDARDLGGLTPLHFASRKGEVEIIKTLVVLGAITEARNGNGWTSLHYASTKGNVEVIKTLVELGASVNALTTAGITPTDIAITMNQEQSAMALIKAGADITINALEQLYNKSWVEKAIYTWLACGCDVEQVSAAFRKAHPHLKKDIADTITEELEPLIAILPKGKQNVLISVINTHATNASTTLVVDKVPSLLTICIHKIMKDTQKVIAAYASGDEVSISDAGTMNVIPLGEAESAE